MREAILAKHSKQQTMSIVNYIGNDQKLFTEFVNVFLGDEYRVTQRGAWVFSHCIKEYPTLITPHHQRLIDELNNKQHHAALRRNIMKVYQDVDIPEEYESIIFDLCIKFLVDAKEPLAVKVYSMLTGLSLVKKYPELKNELAFVIKAGLEVGTPAYLSCSRKVFKAMKLL